ncbi:uncharacterized protein LOC122643520 [Telopea speciosissima]|uniref:uncharacterized protein LOC122643520 n=1 Tax=Telopea speciosissima TaxID=54955 RepID=UPI001CC804B9|nr:uncharacterized protein LOC122643520 [Telopea speciosissima]
MPIPVYWYPPFNAVKLNVDGACRGNPGSGDGGGIIRGYDGRILAAFANFYGDCTNSIVEIRALRDDLQICAEMGFSYFHVNSDSTMVVRCTSSKRCNLWKGWYWFHEIQVLIDSLRPMITFTCREGNSVADWLAN